MKIFKILFVLSWVVCMQSSAQEDLYDRLRLKKWVCGPEALHEQYTWDDAVNYIKKFHPDEQDSWFSNINPTIFCNIVYQAEWGRIWSLGYMNNLDMLFYRDKLIPQFEENDYVLIPFWAEANCMKNRVKLLLKNAKHPQNFFFMANSQKDADMLNEENGVQAFGVSHNAFIDKSVFYPVQKEKEFTAVYCGDTRPQKRLHLAELILPQSLILSHSSPDVLEIVKKAKNILRHPPIERISEHMCKAYCGLILSKHEGGCYASTEYLYCGIPVVSTISIGGRDAYYDEDTAMVVEDDPQKIREAALEWVKRAPNPELIRQKALMVSDKMLDILAYEILQPIFKKYQDQNAQDPRGFVDRVISSSNLKGSKGRTLFQPENSGCDTMKKIIEKQLSTHFGKRKIMNKRYS
jgi:glycosyltransferase involved in cell wall biosynthesis